MNVLITGANRGIGLAMTQQLSEQQITVWAACRKASEQLQSLASQYDVKIIEGVDVTSSESAKRISQQLGDTKLDVLIQNAGILNRESIDHADPDSIQQQFSVNAVAPLMLTIALRPHLKEGSKIALITSRMGSMTDNGSGSYYGYRMSKAALNAAGVSLARDLEPEGIAVALLHPGFVQTDMVNHAGDISAETAAERLIQRINELDMTNTGSFWHSNGELLPF